jgi:hypothetical protein
MRTFALTAGLLLTLGCRHQDAARPPVTATRQAPQTEAECRACNGEWGVHGLRQVTSCLCRTRDAGKVCKDGGDCEGECLVDDGKTEITDPGPPPRGYFLGRCSDFDHVFGCHKLLLDGTKGAGPTPLDQPPTEMCVD